MNRQNYPTRPVTRRRDAITEKIERLDWAALADRNTELPADISLDNLLEHFKKLRQVQLIDRGFLG